MIRVENLSKRFVLGHQRNRHDGLRHRIEDAVRSPFRWLRRGNGEARSEGEEFWALKDVSFGVERGEVVGVIGRNGAGKSTLLKILSRITEPTRGRARIRGRVASLLEVGTGFHPELTGRENIFLNGAILGMMRVEIKKKFDEIVAFSEVERFLDTPVKRYSSGMYVRLAFAVAAHLEPEILIIDEVLAVGDVEFQKKCLGKMESVASKEGRTILFVSHQIAAVTRLCKKVLWLDGGKINEFGRTDLVCSQYLANGSAVASRRVWPSGERAPGDDWVRLESVEALAEGKPADNMDIKSPVDINLTYRVLKSGKVLIPNVHFYADDGTLIFISHDWYSGWRTKPKAPGQYRTTFTVPGNFFSEGRVIVKVAISTYKPFEVHFEEPDAVAFAVAEDAGGETSRGDFGGHLPGIVRPLITSKTEVIGG
ncbi:MAG: ABC transporter ATP-binding protein [Verrucomicrobiota bacterium]|jgi:lipopolysaccharide transport system ATP-binding protein